MDTQKRDQNTKAAFNSVGSFFDQCLQAWEESSRVEFSPLYKDIQNVVVCGMGGSSMPSYVIKTVIPLKVPVSICQTYSLPSWVSEKTLVVLSSYSGNTEETLSCAKEAIKKGCLVTGLMTGGKLHELLENNEISHYLFDPKYNPSKMPRFGTGYGMFGLLGLLNSLSLIDLSLVKDVESALKVSVSHIDAKLEEIKDQVTDFVENMDMDAYMVFSSGHLRGNGLIFANQLSETSKKMSFPVELPEAHHNLVEGLLKLQDSVCGVFITSSTYKDRVQYRHEITKEIFDNSGYKYFVFEPSSGLPMQEMLETLVFSSYCSVFLAKKNGVDPLSIPTIDFIKSKLLT